MMRMRTSIVNLAAALAALTLMIDDCAASAAESPTSAAIASTKVPAEAMIRSIISVLRVARLAFPEVAVVLELLQDWLARNDSQKSDELEKVLRQLDYHLANLPVTINAAVEEALRRALHQNQYKTCGPMKYRGIHGLCIDATNR